MKMFITDCAQDAKQLFIETAAAIDD